MAAVAGSEDFGPPPRAARRIWLARWLEAESERWFLWLPVLYGCGVACYFALPDEPGLAIPLALAVAAAVVVIVARGGGTLAAVAGASVLAVSLGLVAAKARTEWVRAPILERGLVNVSVRGHLELIEPRPGSGQRLTILVAAIEGLAPERTPRRVRIRTAQAATDLRAGDPIMVTASLSPPGAPALPGDYDFGRAAFFAGLGAVGYASGAAKLDPFPGPAPWRLAVDAAVGRARQALSARITAALPGETGAIADALISGERGGISQATNDAYRASGLYHILSISGLHMTVMAGAVYVSLRLVFAAIPALALRYPVKKWAAAAATIAAFAYMLLSGSSIATVRSWIMISIMFLAVLLDRPALALRNVALAALAIMVMMPESLFDAGFQMSFAAVIALIAAYEEIGRRRQQAPSRPRGAVRHGLAFLAGIVLSTVIATAAVAPFAIYHFHATQWYSALANLIAIPVCELVVMPAALATLVAMPFGLEAYPLAVMGLGIDAMTWAAFAVAGLPGAVSRVPAIPPASFVLMVLGGLWICLWQSRVRWAGIVLVAAGAAMAPFAERPDVLVGRNGRLVAVRGEDGKLAAHGERGSAYDLARWLEHDGDRRSARDVLGQAQQQFRCDAVGCTVLSRGGTVAISQHPAAAADDCALAAVVVLAFARPARCVGRALVIDADSLQRHGAHAVRFDAAGPEVSTVAQHRGNRPWSPIEQRAVRRASLSSVARFAPPLSLADPPSPWFPGLDEFVDPRPGDDP